MSSHLASPDESGSPGASAPGTAIRLRGVSKRFGRGERTVWALEELSLEIPRGGITGVVGPDGAGKTTLMRLCAGLMRCDRGQVVVLDQDITRDAAAIQGRIGYMPQRFGLYEDLSVAENLNLYADLQGVPRHQRPERFQMLMQMTGLAPFLGRLAGKLSGGMKQKLGLACALVRSPELLLLDEPTVGVDPLSRRELWAIVRRFEQEEGTTVLLSTAYLDEAQRCDRVLMLDRGRLLAQGTPQWFQQQVQGRVFRIRSPRLTPRQLQAQVLGRPGVIDAALEATWVRVVVDSPQHARAEHLAPGVDPVEVEPIPPRFEDAFMELLSRDQGEQRPAAINVARSGASRAAKAADSDVVIQVQDLKRRFGDFWAVGGISFQVHRGEVFGLLGANGAGKTTTFRMLCGLLPPSGGTLRVAGVDMRRAPAQARARIGYMSQKFSLYRTLSVMQNLRFFSSAYGLRGRRRRARLQWALEQFQLAEVAGTDSGQLPLGYQQRLAMACALMHEPEIVFLDEPTSGADPVARRQFWQRINALAMQGVTVLVTTHFMEEAQYCDRMAIMIDGRLAAVDTPENIRLMAQSPENPEPTIEDAFIQLILAHRKRQ